MAKRRGADYVQYNPLDAALDPADLAMVGAEPADQAKRRGLEARVRAQRVYAEDAKPKSKSGKMRPPPKSTKLAELRANLGAAPLDIRSGAGLSAQPVMSQAPDDPAFLARAGLVPRVVPRGTDRETLPEGPRLSTIDPNLMDRLLADLQAPDEPGSLVVRDQPMSPGEQKTRRQAGIMQALALLGPAALGRLRPPMPASAVAQVAPVVDVAPTAGRLPPGPLPIEPEVMPPLDPTRVTRVAPVVDTTAEEIVPLPSRLGPNRQLAPGYFGRPPITGEGLLRPSPPMGPSRTLPNNTGGTAQSPASIEASLVSKSPTSPMRPPPRTGILSLPDAEPPMNTVAQLHPASDAARRWAQEPAEVFPFPKQQNPPGSSNVSAHDNTVARLRMPALADFLDDQAAAVEGAQYASELEKEQAGPLLNRHPSLAPWVRGNHEGMLKLGANPLAEVGAPYRLPSALKAAFGGEPPPPAQVYQWQTLADSVPPQIEELSQPLPSIVGRQDQLMRGLYGVRPEILPRSTGGPLGGSGPFALADLAPSAPAEFGGATPPPALANRAVQNLAQGNVYGSVPGLAYDSVGGLPMESGLPQIEEVSRLAPLRNPIRVGEQNLVQPQPPSQPPAEPMSNLANQGLPKQQIAGDYGSNGPAFPFDQSNAIQWYNQTPAPQPLPPPEVMQNELATNFNNLGDDRLGMYLLALLGGASAGAAGGYVGAGGPGVGPAQAAPAQPIPPMIPPPRAIPHPRAIQRPIPLQDQGTIQPQSVYDAYQPIRRGIRR